MRFIKLITKHFLRNNMELKNFVNELERQNPNGRFIHPIREYGYTIMDYVKRYLNKNRRADLYVAHEYLKSLNKIIGKKYSLREIFELNNCDLINEIESWDNL